MNCQYKTCERKAWWKATMIQDDKDTVYYECNKSKTGEKAKIAVTHEVFHVLYFCTRHKDKLHTRYVYGGGMLGASVGYASLPLVPIEPTPEEIIALMEKN